MEVMDFSWMSGEDFLEKMMFELSLIGSVIFPWFGGEEMYGVICQALQLYKQDLG